MRTTLQALLDSGHPLLADGATGTNFMGMGLGPGEPPELWNVGSPTPSRAGHPAMSEYQDARGFGA